MFRVVTKYRNGTARPVVERGPWHTSRQTAEEWADTLRHLGYVVHVEAQHGLVDGGAKDDNAMLADALASMA